MTRYLYQMGALFTDILSGQMPLAGVFGTNPRMKPARIVRDLFLRQRIFALNGALRFGSNHEVWSFAIIINLLGTRGGLEKNSGGRTSVSFEEYESSPGIHSVPLSPAIGADILHNQGFILEVDRTFGKEGTPAFAAFTRIYFHIGFQP